MVSVTGLQKSSSETCWKDDDLSNSQAFMLELLDKIHFEQTPRPLGPLLLLLRTLRALGKRFSDLVRQKLYSLLILSPQ